MPVAQLASPFNGATINASSLGTRPYIDVTFQTTRGGTLAGIDGDEIRLSGAGRGELRPRTRRRPARRLPERDARSAQDRPDDVPLLPDAEGRRHAGDHVRRTASINVELVAVVPGATADTWAPAWRVRSPTARSSTRRAASAPFTVDSTAHGRRDRDARVALGPLSLVNPTIGLANTKFKDGKLVLTVGIEVNEATIFGGTAGASARREADRHPRHVRHQRRRR